MKTFIIDFFKWFLIINTGIMVVVGINIFQYDSITTLIIPQILVASLLTSLVTTAFFAFNPRKPIKVAVRVMLVLGHFLVLCAIIMALGTSFGWFEFTTKGCLIVVLSVAGVYFISALTSYILSKGEAKELTDALKKYSDEG